MIHGEEGEEAGEEDGEGEEGLQEVADSLDLVLARGSAGVLWNPLTEMLGHQINPDLGMDRYGNDAQGEVGTD